MGLIGVAFGLGFIFGPTIGGMMSRISSGAPFYFAGATGRINAFLVYILLPESLSPEHRVAAAGIAPRFARSSSTAGISPRS